MMKRRTKSILQEINNYVPAKNKDQLIENRGKHMLESAINLIDLINENYDEETAGELTRRFLNSIRTGKDKFTRGVRKHREED